LMVPCRFTPIALSVPSICDATAQRWPQFAHGETACGNPGFPAF
jgi:hypothetical protein